MKKIKNDQFEITPIEKTPFAMLKDNEKKEVWIILGNEKIKKCNTEEEAKKSIKKYDWDLIGPIIMKIARFEAQQTIFNNNNKKQ